MSSLAPRRLATIACSLVAASVGSLAFADVAYVPAAGAPVMRRAPQPQAPAPVDEPYRIPDPAPHYAKPPPARLAPRDSEPAMDREQLRVVLKAKRAQNLAAFRAYEATGVFPSNTFTNDSLNVWRDRDGHLCAAATIISKSGATELVARVADQNNYIKLADVQQGPLEDWILTSGFTQEELVAIQKPFRPVARPTPEPRPVPVVEPDLRTAETARLKTIYKQVEAQLVKDQDKSLDVAAARLLKHPTLAWQALGYATTD